ncbi:hypothetical protein [Arthrobacter sp. AZCC_0090]|uniref:hypothetical protein n=1 Tax=Arthrobacter sp. AZCC_0090 TaxID=2735881 RepID=UPI00161CB93A|nr:hypothetical protein [Arthrobacter sp. AZCC_0090]MBB6404149.1 putative membrane protein [Arthrobacter sp. AZCC_0090]
MGVAVVLGAISGLYGSTFGSFRAIFVGVIVAAVGEFAGLTLRGTTRAVLAFGITVVIGAFGYILLGI